MAIRKGGAAVEKAAERKSSGKFLPNLKWEANETKFLQFITPMDEIATALMHNFIIVGFREDGSKMYESFISPLDEGLIEEHGQRPDPLVERFEETPTSKCIALAVELAPRWKQNGTRKSADGFDVVYRQYETKDGETKEVPNVALTIMSPSNFFSHLKVLDDMRPIEEQVFAVKRTGKSTDTQYTFAFAGEALDLGDVLEEVEFDFDGYLEGLADYDRLVELIDPLPDDFVVNPYNKKRKGKSSSGSSSSGSSQRSRRVTESQEEPEAEADAPAERPQRSRRFGGLKEAIGTPVDESEPESGD